MGYFKFSFQIIVTLFSFEKHTCEAFKIIYTPFLVGIWLVGYGNLSTLTKWFLSYEIILQLKVISIRLKLCHGVVSQQSWLVWILQRAHIWWWINMLRHSLIDHVNLIYLVNLLLNLMILLLVIMIVLWNTWSNGIECG